ncbi:thiamine-phosphate pyrophosphorylase [Helicobacter sp. 12S02634-8]|uniref:thiamine-phosphate pyrophosphorylase n=1 Tax=Helicobacter sp. 12S02634-8 TaxID=1476199 RepID=UPI000BA4EC89|nr:thiamine-phosphate pyrophosphorylase [Helicobacter sp. 12S02634-8]PAF47739.1 thiamine-phosphate pyrophosphorylase [Helicobacter sp. 12S02634-8]
MEEKTDLSSIQRILDANLNRLKEGIRVVEDTARYLQNDKELASKLKDLRHRASLKSFTLLLSSRIVTSDVLRDTIPSETRRDGVYGIVLANFKRAQESARTLEEYLKCKELQVFGESECFKNIRYDLYEIEKIFVLRYFKEI